MICFLFYREVLTNGNPHFNDNGSLTYNPKRELIFDPEKSIGDPKTDYVNSFNIPLLVKLFNKN